MNIRNATRLDAPGIRAVHHAAIRGICASAYSADQIDAWISVLTLDRYVSERAGFGVLVAEQAGSIIGFSEVDIPGAELNALYVAPSDGGHGVGSTLLKAAEGLAVEAGLQRLTLKSTLNAVTFYQRAGYSQLGPAIHALPTGQKLPCVLMSKQLAETQGAA
jgi:putative acetyltransferase